MDRGRGGGERKRERLVKVERNGVKGKKRGRSGEGKVKAIRLAEGAKELRRWKRFSGYFMGQKREDWWKCHRVVFKEKVGEREWN